MEKITKSIVRVKFLDFYMNPYFCDQNGNSNKKLKILKFLGIQLMYELYETRKQYVTCLLHVESTIKYVEIEQFWQLCDTRRKNHLTRKASCMFSIGVILLCFYKGAERLSFFKSKIPYHITFIRKNFQTKYLKLQRSTTEGRSWWPGHLKTTPLHWKIRQQ